MSDSENKLNDKEHKPRIAVIGSGSWATAIIKILTEKSVRIRWYLRKETDIEFIKKFGHNPRYLSDIALNLRRIKPVNTLARALKEVDTVFLVTPAAFLKESLEGLTPAMLEGKTIVTAIKGIIPGETELITDWLEKHYNIPKEKLAIVAGPCHAEEVALERLSYLTIGAYNTQTATEVAELLACRYIKTSVSADLVGIELSAIMKNIVAICCGICHGLNHGDNFQSVLVANALQEIERFLDKAMPLQRNVQHSAYLGDLLVTAYSQFSRNRTFGNMIGRGYSVTAAQMEMNMVAEGYYAVKSVYEMNLKLQVDMPILEATYRILYQKASPTAEIEILKDRLS
jgi:glycerol-3-phosphate dehydrogenase (NAD(P)+)